MQIRSGVKGALLTAVAAMLVLTTSNAKANGRFPRGEHLIEYPSDPNRMLLAATYGLVNTDDGGKNWYYICETAFSLYDPPSTSNPGYLGDPLLQLSANESLVAGVDVRVTRSTDHGCGWTATFEPLGKAVVDIAAAPSNRDNIFALVSSQGGMLQVYQSTDGGLKFDPIGTPLTMIVLGYTIDVDPKDPNHLMVTGVTSYSDMGDTGVFLNSTNKGMTWASSPIPKTNVNAPPYIAGVHPTDGKIVFVRTDEWPDDGGGANFANDALIYTKDGGMTWSELLRPTTADGGAKLFGFAISPDGGTVLAGYGDPVLGGGRNVNRDVMGVYKSSGADYAFGAMPKATFVESATCLTWTAKGVYVCGSPDGMTSYVAFASDVKDVTSAGLTKIMQVNQLKGEPPCCNGRAVATCEWPVECQRFQACPDGGTSTVDAGVCTMPEAGRPDGGTGGSGGAAGAGGRDGSAGSGAAGAAGAGMSGAAGAGRDGGAGASTGGSGGSGGSATGGATSTGAGGTGESDSSCSCRTVGGSNGAGAPALGVLFGLIGASGWRRSRRQGRTS